MAMDTHIFVDMTQVIIPDINVKIQAIVSHQ
jgi:hypothetical protein